MKKKKLKTISFKIVDVALFADYKAAKDTIDIDDEISVFIPGSPSHPREHLQ